MTVIDRTRGDMLYGRVYIFVGLKRQERYCHSLEGKCPLDT